MTTWLVNGQRDGRLSPTDRGLAYGDGLFETIALRTGRLRFLDYHFERLVFGCERLGIPVPDTDQLTQELETAREDCTDGTAKIIITRGVGPRGYRPPPAALPTRVVGVTATDASVKSVWREGIRVRLCDTRLSENETFGGMKTLNRLEQVMARNEWRTPDIAEGLMMTDSGHVICGTASNLFLVRDDTLLTPSLERCGVRGVMRRVILEEAERLGIVVQRPVVTRAMLAAAEEVFVSNSLQGIGPVTAWNDERYGVGELTRALMAGLAERGVQECTAG
ncbi:MAG: aminodeoxychorismate lyase [Chromatiales bacterium]|nr:MAG: aminodeoxychorismate lyase [Chromatiales bacterium]